MGKKIEYVTTDYDMWNSADELHFFVLRGQVKLLPEIISPIIEDAINQKMLREPTKLEMENHTFEMGLEEAIKNGKIKPGVSYDETAELYRVYRGIEEEERKEEEKKEIESVLVIEPAEGKALTENAIIENNDEEPDDAIDSPSPGSLEEVPDKKPEEKAQVKKTKPAIAKKKKKKPKSKRGKK